MATGDYSNIAINTDGDLLTFTLEGMTASGITAVASGKTIEIIRDVIEGPVHVYGPRFWSMHKNYIDPAELWEIYRSCGVVADGFSVGVVGMSQDQAQAEIESKMKQTDAPLNVLTDGEQPECVELALKYGLTAVRWYRKATTGVKGGW